MKFDFEKQTKTVLLRNLMFSFVVSNSPLSLLRRIKNALIYCLIIPSTTFSINTNGPWPILMVTYEIATRICVCLGEENKSTFSVFYFTQCVQGQAFKELDRLEFQLNQNE